MLSLEHSFCCIVEESLGKQVCSLSFSLYVPYCIYTALKANAGAAVSVLAQISCLTKVLILIIIMSNNNKVGIPSYAFLPTLPIMFDLVVGILHLPVYASYSYNLSI